MHPGVEDIVADPRVSSCDDLYEQQPTFQALYRAIASACCVNSERTHRLRGARASGRRRLRNRCPVSCRRAGHHRPHYSWHWRTGCDRSHDRARPDGRRRADRWMHIISAIGLRRRRSTDHCWISVRLRPLVVTQVYKPSDRRNGQIGPRNHLPGRTRSLGDRVGRDRRRQCRPTDPSPPARPGRFDHLTASSCRRHPGNPTAIPIRNSSGSSPAYATKTAAHGTVSKRHDRFASAVIEEAFEVVDAIDRATWPPLTEELGDLLIGRPAGPDGRMKRAI